MEFQTTTVIPVSVADLQHCQTIGKLSRWCVSIEQMLREEESSGEICSLLTSPIYWAFPVKSRIPQHNSLSLTCYAIKKTST